MKTDEKILNDMETEKIEEKISPDIKEEFADTMESLKEIAEENYERMKELSELKLTPTFYRLGIFNGPVVF